MNSTLQKSHTSAFSIQHGLCSQRLLICFPSVQKTHISYDACTDPYPQVHLVVTLAVFVKNQTTEGLQVSKYFLQELPAPHSFSFSLCYMFSHI